VDVGLGAEANRRAWPKDDQQGDHSVKSGVP